MKQLTLDMTLGEGPSFDTFIAGSNEGVLRQWQQCLQAGPPLYVWGPSGSGKTHLLKSLVRQWRLNGREVAWFDVSTSLPWELPAGTRLVAMDQCEQWDAAAQHAAFALFQQATSSGVQVAAAGRMPPIDLPLREDLRTRLGWGLVSGLHPLDDAQLRAALKLEAQRRGIVLSDEVLSYVLTRFSRELKSLTWLLDRMDRYALELQRPVTVPLLKRMLEEEGLQA